MRTSSWVIGVLVGTLGMAAAGCTVARTDIRPTVSVEASSPSTAVPTPPRAEASRLARHVEILTDPQLAGRHPLEPGGLRAGGYVAERFAEYGLKPWAGEAGYAQHFGAGVNIIAVLPGGDPALADEFVVLSAHYDHLGVRNGVVFPGAADNAAGVAVLLETARVLAGSPQRPARSVVFAAFDAEEQGLYGSYMFSAREDFDEPRFAGLVNLDMLGRATFDAHPNTLLAVGTRRFPQLRAALRASADDAGLGLHPVGRELVGPRSDHVAFEPMDRPWVFLTCGPFADYHTPRDTPDKLDLSALERSARVVLDAVTWLADVPLIEPPTEPETGDRAEFESILILLDGIEQTLPNELKPSFSGLRRQIQSIGRAPDYSIQDHRQTHQLLIMALAPIQYGRELSFAEIFAVTTARWSYVDQTGQYVEERRLKIVEALSSQSPEIPLHSHD
ncbi:MAG: M28 family peptidase [Planctomycetota bacterium]